MPVDLAFALGKMATIVSSVASGVRSIEHLAENKQVKSHVPELARDIREVREQLESLLKTVQELSQHIEAHERAAEDHLAGMENKLNVVRRALYVVGVMTTGSALYIILHVAKLVR